jgi:hypothetical protein
MKSRKPSRRGALALGLITLIAAGTVIFLGLGTYYTR